MGRGGKLRGGCCGKADCGHVDVIGWIHHRANDGLELGLGEGGERLHDWVYELASFRERHGQDGGKTGADDEVLKEAFETTGAFLMGRRMFENTGGERMELETTRVIDSPEVTHLKFRVVK